MQNYNRIENIPVITEYVITILAKDVPHSEYFYEAHQVKSVLDKLVRLNKKYVLGANIYPVH